MGIFSLVQIVIQVGTNLSFLRSGTSAADKHCHFFVLHNFYKSLRRLKYLGQGINIK